MELTLVILAAGMGSRFGGPKQVQPVGPCGETLLDYSVFDAIRAGFGRAVFVIREELASIFREQIFPRFEGRIRCEMVFQRNDDLPSGYVYPEGRVKPWGTAHAVLATRKQVKTPFLSLNADDFYGREAFQAMAEFLGKFSSKDGPPYEGSLVGYRLRDTLSPHGTVARGICKFSEQGYLTEIEEMTKIGFTAKGEIANQPAEGVVQTLQGDELVSMNFWGFPPEIFELLEGEFLDFLRENSTSVGAEFLLPTTVQKLIQRNLLRVRVLPGGKNWLGMTYVADKDAVVAQIRQLTEAGEYPTPLWP
ncbi:MAG: NTP transferase domain-containing protein [Chthoniobacterales bacterium]|nr:NTP transferase domain-containing protein [Chthoniobacterales bacterium]